MLGRNSNKNFVKVDVNIVFPVMHIPVLHEPSRTIIFDLGNFSIWSSEKIYAFTTRKWINTLLVFLLKERIRNSTTFFLFTTSKSYFSWRWKEITRKSWYFTFTTFFPTPLENISFLHTMYFELFNLSTCHNSLI